MTLLATNPIDERHPGQSAAVLAIGPWHRGEFNLLSSKFNSRNEWFAVDNCAQAESPLRKSETIPKYILIAQPLPGDVRQEEIEHLRLAAPLSQIVIVAGSWCEGELRTGKPPIGVLRMYWHEFANWWPECQWSACLDGSLAVRSPHLSFTDPRVGLVAIHTSDLTSFETLSKTLALAEFDALWVRKTDTLSAEVTAGIWDGGQLDTKELAELQLFAAEIRSNGSQLVVLLDYPRNQHFDALRELGCKAILGKPYIVEELISACSYDN